VSAEQPWYASRGVIWSGALLAVILLVGAGVALTGGSERRGAGAATVSAAAVDMSWGSRCGLPHGSQDPIVGPPRAQWTLVAGIPVRVNGTLAYAVLPMRWTDPGDWRVQPLGAAGPFEAGPLDSMADYIPWSA
jgi:hypothetical protein